MSKRLVKTAKQQFEERLSELKNPFIERIADNTYYSCNDNDGHFVVLSKYEGSYDEYSEYVHEQSLMDVYTDSDFLCSLVDYWNEHRREPLKDLFEWYATADKDNPPFSVEVILQCCKKGACFSFKDYYEEVPDVRVITAQEQWEKESTGAETISTLSNGSVYKVMQTDASLTFFVHQNGEYFKEVYPPLEELRKNAHFAMAYLSHVRAMHDSDLCSALDWIQTGNYTMDGLTLLDIYEVTNCKDHVCYHDKEEPSQKLPGNVVEMNMYDPFNWLRAEGCGTWEIITEYCNNEKEYGRLDALYRIIEGTLNVEDEFCNPPTEEEIKEDYQKNFPLLLAGVFENLADAIRKGELTFVMDYSK